MMSYDPLTHRRRSIRLKEYDYSQSGAYFVTICARNRECLFGKVNSSKMQMNSADSMVTRWYGELENKFKNIQCDEFICMPNHIHFIIINVGADLCVRPATDMGKHTLLGEHTGSPLRKIVQWFKTMTTNEYIRGVKQHGWQPFPGKLWQRNYWERIVRNEIELHQIREYIQNNPSQWGQDKLNPDLKISEPLPKSAESEEWMV